MNKIIAAIFGLMLIASAHAQSINNPISFPPFTYYVDALGAIGNGTFDDTAAFTAAFSACGNTGGTVSIGAKRYLINSASITLPSNCRLIGSLYPGAGHNSLNFSTVPYTILLNPTYTITTGTANAAGGQEVRGVYIINSNMTTPTNLRTAINLVATFAGTAITVGATDTHIIDTTILGFNTAVSSSGFGRTVVERTYIDSINGVLISNCHDTCRVSDTQTTYYTTVNVAGGSTAAYAVSGAANNGSGLYRINLATNAIVTGDVINLGGMNIQALNNRWTATVIDSTHIDLQGSSAVAPTATGTTIAGQNSISVSSTTNLGPGQTVTGTGIPGSTTVTAVWQNQNIVWLSNAATASGSATLTFTDPAYTSGGATVLTALARRGGIAYSVTNAENVEFINAVAQSQDTGFYFGTGAGWARCKNCAIDSNTVVNNGGSDPLQVGVWFDSTSFSGSFQGYTTSINTAVRSTSSGPVANSVVDSNLGTGNATFSQGLEIAGSNRLLLIGNQATNSVNNCLLSDAAGAVTMSANDLFLCTTYFQTYAGLNKVSSANRFANTSLIPSTQVGLGSLVINGDFQLDQPHEGGAFTSCSLTVDRWRCASNNGNNFTWQRINDAPAPYTYSLKVTNNSALTIGSSSTQTNLNYSAEGVDLINLGWGTTNAQPVALDFSIKTSVTGTYTAFLRQGGGNLSYLLPYTITQANTWTNFSFIIPGPTTSTWTPNANGGGFGGSQVIGFDFGSGSALQSATSNAWISGDLKEITGSGQLFTNNGATWQIAAVHLRPGNQTGTPYTTMPGAMELARAQRFYRKSFQAGVPPAQNVGLVGARCVTNPIAVGRPSVFVPFDPPMAATPTITTFNPSAANANWRDVTAGADVTVSVDPASAKGMSGVNLSTGATVTTLADELCIHYVADSGN
jgi:hypothetical protein